MEKKVLRKKKLNSYYVPFQDRPKEFDLEWELEMIPGIRIEKRDGEVYIMGFDELDPRDIPLTVHPFIRRCVRKEVRKRRRKAKLAGAAAASRLPINNL